MKCPVCKRDISEKSNFCSNCGSCVTADMSATPVCAKKTLGTRKKLVVMLFFACFTIGVLAVAMVLGISSLKKNIAENEKRIDDYERKISNMEKESILSEKTNNIVYVPNDGSYLFHSFECKHYNHDLYCLVIDRSIAENYGCEPCQYCLGSQE